MSIKPTTRTQAKADGFAAFNNGPHLCIDVPDRHFTITARTSSGKKITFAFVPYGDGDHCEASCIDIKQHDIDKQQPILFGNGAERDPYHYNRDNATDVGIIAVVLK